MPRSSRDSSACRQARFARPGPRCNSQNSSRRIRLADARHGWTSIVRGLSPGAGFSPNRTVISGASCSTCHLEHQGARGPSPRSPSNIAPPAMASETLMHAFAEAGRQVPAAFFAKKTTPGLALHASARPADGYTPVFHGFAIDPPGISVPPGAAGGRMATRSSSITSFISPAKTSRSSAVGSSSARIATSPTEPGRSCSA